MTALNEMGRVGFVVVKSTSDLRSSEQEPRRQLMETRWSGT